MFRSTQKLKDDLFENMPSNDLFSSKGNNIQTELQGGYFGEEVPKDFEGNNIYVENNPFSVVITKEGIDKLISLQKESVQDKEYHNTVIHNIILQESINLVIYILDKKQFKKVFLLKNKVGDTPLHLFLRVFSSSNLKRTKLFAGNLSQDTKTTSTQTTTNNITTSPPNFRSSFIELNSSNSNNKGFSIDNFSIDDIEDGMRKIESILLKIFVFLEEEGENVVKIVNKKGDSILTEMILNNWNFEFVYRILRTFGSSANWNCQNALIRMVEMRKNENKDLDENEVKLIGVFVRNSFCADTIDLVFPQNNKFLKRFRTKFCVDFENFKDENGKFFFEILKDFHKNHKKNPENFVNFEKVTEMIFFLFSVNPKKEKVCFFENFEEKDFDNFIKLKKKNFHLVLKKKLKNLEFPKNFVKIVMKLPSLKEEENLNQNSKEEERENVFKRMKLIEELINTERIYFHNLKKLWKKYILKIEEIAGELDHFNHFDENSSKSIKSDENYNQLFSTGCFSLPGATVDLIDIHSTILSSIFKLFSQQIPQETPKENEKSEKIESEKKIIEEKDNNVTIESSGSVKGGGKTSLFIEFNEDLELKIQESLSACFGELLKHYTSFYSNFSSIERLSSYPYLKSYLQMISNGHLEELDSLLINPVQRLPRINLLLRDYIKQIKKLENLSNRNKISQSLSIAIQNQSLILECLENLEEKRRISKAQHYGRIASKFLLQNNINLGEKGSNCIFCGDSLKVIDSCFPKIKHIKIFVFPEALFVVHKNSDANALSTLTKLVSKHVVWGFVNSSKFSSQGIRVVSKVALKFINTGIEEKYYILIHLKAQDEENGKGNVWFLICLEDSDKANVLIKSQNLFDGLGKNFLFENEKSSIPQFLQ